MSGRHSKTTEKQRDKTGTERGKGEREREREIDRDGHGEHGVDRDGEVQKCEMKEKCRATWRGEPPRLTADGSGTELRWCDRPRPAPRGIDLNIFTATAASPLSSSSPSTPLSHSHSLMHPTALSLSGLEWVRTTTDSLIGTGNDQGSTVNVLL